MAGGWRRLGALADLSSDASYDGDMGNSNTVLLRLFIHGLRQTTDDGIVGVQFDFGAGTITSGYQRTGASSRSGAHDNGWGGVGEASMRIASNGLGYGLGNAAGEAMDAEFNVHRPQVTGLKRCWGFTSHEAPNGTNVNARFAGQHVSETGALSGFTIVGGGGLVAGSVEVWELTTEFVPGGGGGAGGGAAVLPILLRRRRRM